MSSRLARPGRHRRIVALVAHFACASLVAGLSGAAVANAGASRAGPPGLTATAVATAAAAAADVDDALRLHSLPGADRVIYLDFDGGPIVGTFWNDKYTSGATITPSPFDVDGSPTTLSPVEKSIIRSTWARVAEDFAPFAVDVTTEDPGFAAIDRADTADTAYGKRVVVTNDRQYHVESGPCGGESTFKSFAHLSGMDMTGSMGSYSKNRPHAYFQPTFIFVGEPGCRTAESIGNTVSHEVGHDLGLEHDGVIGGTQYYGGQGVWVPIMGGAPAAKRPLSQWNRGEYTGATSTQDDLAVIASNGIPLRADDHPDTREAARSLGSLGPDGRLTATGIIGTRTDVDWFSFSTTGIARIDVEPARVSPDLDVRIDVYDAAGGVVDSADPPVALASVDVADGLSASVTLPASAKGMYYVRVDGVGYGDPTKDGYSDYGSLGWYTISVGNAVAATRTLYVALALAGTSDGTCAHPDFNDIQAAVDAAAAGDTIHVCAGTYALSAEVVATKDLGFVGDGASTTILDGGGAHRILSAPDRAISLAGLTLRNGATSNGGNGGALTARTITIDRCVFTGNTGGAYGGAAWASGSLTARHSTFSGNRVALGSDPGGGGALRAYESLTVTDSTFSGNRARYGGAVHAYVVTVANSTFSGNSADVRGGAINGLAVTVTNSTFSANTAPTGGTIHGVTNVDTTRGGTPAVTVTSSVIAQDGVTNACTGTITDNGGNRSTDASCGFSAATSKVVTLAALKLGPLADNGGPTQTIALLPGSVAIDTGLDAACAAAPVSGQDQRSVARPYGAHCDSGAYEAAAPTVVRQRPAPGAAGVSRAVTIIVTFSEPVTGVSASTFVLRDKATGRVVKAAVTYDAATRTAVLRPKSTLGSRRSYVASLSPRITGTAANHLRVSTWTFSVRR